MFGNCYSVFALVMAGLDMVDELNVISNLRAYSVDHIALPSKGGAMENWGLITYGESELLYDSASDTLDFELWISSYFTHELAHQVKQGCMAFV